MHRFSASLIHNTPSGTDVDPIDTLQSKFYQRMSGSTRTLCFVKSIHTYIGTSNLLCRPDPLPVVEHPDSSVFDWEERKSAHFAVDDLLAVLGDVRDCHAVDDVLDILADQDVRGTQGALDKPVDEGNLDNLADLDNQVDVAVDTLVGVLDNQVAIADFVDLVVDILDIHLATLAVVGHIAGYGGVLHSADLDIRQVASDTTCLHPADSNYHSFISTTFIHNETDQYVADQCLYTPNGICVDSTETLRRIVDRQMLDKTRIHYVVKSIHT